MSNQISSNHIIHMFKLNLTIETNIIVVLLYMQSIESATQAIVFCLLYSHLPSVTACPWSLWVYACTVYGKPFRGKILPISRCLSQPREFTHIFTLAPRAYIWKAKNPWKFSSKHNFLCNRKSFPPRMFCRIQYIRQSTLALVIAYRSHYINRYWCH